MHTFFWTGPVEGVIHQVMQSSGYRWVSQNSGYLYIRVYKNILGLGFRLIRVPGCLQHMSRWRLTLGNDVQARNGLGFRI